MGITMKRQVIPFFDTILYQEQGNVVAGHSQEISYD